MVQEFHLVMKIVCNPDRNFITVIGDTTTTTTTKEVIGRNWECMVMEG